MTIIGYLGPQGTHSEIACADFIARSNRKNLIAEPRSTFYDLFEGLATDQLDLIIVPIENSVQGAVAIPVDLMISHPDFRINSEVVISVQNKLIARPESQLSDIEIVLSHEQPLMQCQNSIRSLLPNASLVPVTSTAQAVKLLISAPNPTVSDAKKTAVIGHSQLADQYDLIILNESVNDYPNNQTRFWVVSKSSSESTGHDKTTLVFTLEKDRPGGLAKVLESLAKRDINILLLTHRPSKTALGEYVFWIDIEGHQTDEKVRPALDEIQQHAQNFRCLGSYERDPQC